MRELSYNECVIASGGEIWANADGTIEADGDVTMTIKDGKTTMTTADGWRYESSGRGVWEIFDQNNKPTDRSSNYDYQFLIP